MSTAFYNSDPIPSGRGWLVFPVRRFIRRLQRPYYFKLQSLIDGLTAQLNQMQRELSQLRQETTKVQQELSQVRQEGQRERQETVQKVRALACDHTAVVRRLAMIEDEVVSAFVRADQLEPCS